MNLDKLSDLKSYITFVALSAPAKFPKLGPFTGDPSADLEHAFRTLRDGVERFKRKLPDEKQSFVTATLNDAHLAYLARDAMKGAHLLQDIQDA